MDETQSSRVSEGAASRKRRSSILKSQRAPRAPFSELEFNVATPTDAGKSRRVSFSRRTGVAEFVTNEATTTWKNFYEEHNKSLESSGNESGANAARPSIGHIGKRIFDQQFEEVEAVDYESAIIPGNSRAAEFNISINNVNLTQQLAAFECSVDNNKLTAPQQHFELSSLTDHQSKVFSNDLTIPVMGEMSNQINVNFSLMNPIGNSNDKCDDLDEIQKDLERSHNVVCPGLFREQNMSEYIEIDLNMTHVPVANDESDMSITDTIHSPKVQEVSTSVSVNKSKQIVMDKDWTTDKENIAVLNPYVSPRESDNFAVNEEPDQVLVFDGKRLIVQSEKKEIPVSDNKLISNEEKFRQTVSSDLHNNDLQLENIPQRKTIVLNTDDDLPNFSYDRMLLQRQDVESVSTEELKNTMIFDEGNLSMTQAVQNIVEPSHDMELSYKQKTSVDGNTTGNISLTQAVPSNVIIDQNNTREKRKTIIFDNSHGNISMTQAIPANVLLDDKSDGINKRRTTIYDGDNVSLTEVVPANLIFTESKDKSSNKTILFQNNMEDISFTQVIPNNMHLEKSLNNRTTVFERSVSNVSMTQVVPYNIILFDSEPVSNKRKTIVFESDDANISMTQAIPANLIITEKSKVDEHKSNEEISSDDLKEKVVTINPHSVDVSIHTCKNIPNRKLTIVYDELADISITQALPTNIVSANNLTITNQKKLLDFDTETCRDSSMEEVSKDVSLKEEMNYKVMSQKKALKNQDLAMGAIDSNSSEIGQTGLIINSGESKTDNDINHYISANTKNRIDMKDISNNEIGNLSLTKPIPDKIFKIENEILNKDLEKFNNLTQFGENTLLQDTIHEKSNIFVYQAEEKLEIPICKTDENYANLKEEKLNTSSVGVDRDCASSKSTRSKSSISNNNDTLEEKDFDMQTSLKSNDNVVEQNHVEAEKSSNKISQDTKGKKSILYELLDMSNTSVADEIPDKNIKTQVDVEIPFEESKKSTENSSSDAIFFITGDKDEKLQTDNRNLDNNMSDVKTLDVKKTGEVESTPIPALDCKAEKDNILEDKLLELRQSINEKKRSPLQNRYYEKILSSDLQARSNQEVKDAKTRKSFKEADDTKELLEILSDFTDRKSVAPVQEDEKVVPQIKLRRSIALEHKAEAPEPRRLSFAPNRQSIVLTREELLNNLSMAQATLQQSRFDIDDSEIDDTATESPTEINDSITSPKKSVRMSNEVVKTLHFEDESFSDLSLNKDVKMSPLKKTAFGETSYMKACKSNVIPTYLKDVSDNIKALMSDLVKPRPDQMPFEVITPKTKKLTSTCSTQIQANLITSSQIDLDVELHSNVNSVYELNKAESLVSDVADMGNKSVSRALKARVSAVTDVSEFDMGNKLYAARHGNSSLKKHSQEPVLIFDHRNPLNNILLAPPDCVDVHKYNPVKSSHVLKTEDNSNNSKEVEDSKSKKGEVERVITQYNVENLVGLQSGDACPDRKGDSNTLFSDPSKPLSMDRSTEGFTMEVKNTEVNTVIAMKGNKELLEASSSLTLVDDALTQNEFDIGVETRSNDQNSPVKVIYKIDDEDVTMLGNIDSDLVSNDDEPMEYTKARKRSYSPSRRDLTRPSTLSSPDVTPKPVSKMQKISTSPQVDGGTDRDDPMETSDKTDDSSERIEPHRKRSSRKSKSSPKHKKPGTDVTVQQLITEYKITKMEQDLIEDQIIEAIHDRMSMSRNELDAEKSRDCSPDAVSSCTSSKGQRETASYVGSQPSRVDWQPELKEPSSTNVLTECESGVNVVAKIDMLPFMGKECEWETSGGDTWVFRLLRARLRLRVRLAHRHHNALRTRVRADTPVEELAVDAVPIEEKDTLAALCVSFAAQAMQYECLRGGGGGGGGGTGAARAGDVPGVLRRCAGVARLALRWARAMRDARTRLAYTLTRDGLLTLKVANIALRSVWEVSMRLELVVGDAREAAWARAGDVRVRRVLAASAPGADEVARALTHVPHDWGHAPRTVWKIFRYLKNKTREDDFLRL